jgi:hypothetical protein
VPGHRPHGVSRPRANLAHHLPVAEEGDVLAPGHPDHDLEAVTQRRVEQRRLGHGVDAYGIHPGLRHQGEVTVDLLQWGKLGTVRVGGEGAIGDTLDQEAAPSTSRNLPDVRGPAAV